MFSSLACLFCRSDLVQTRGERRSLSVQSPQMMTMEGLRGNASPASSQDSLALSSQMENGVRDERITLGSEDDDLSSMDEGESARLVGTCACAHTS